MVKQLHKKGIEVIMEMYFSDETPELITDCIRYWVMEYHLAPASVQALLITLFVVFDALIIYILYKKVIYKHLDNIKKNIEELKDICTE